MSEMVHTCVVGFGEIDGDLAADAPGGSDNEGYWIGRGRHLDGYWGV